MNWQSVFTGMLPEHLLLIGIVLLLILEIASDKPRGALGLSLVIVGGATAAAAWLHFTGYAAAPFPGHFSVDASSALAKAVVLALAVPVLLLARDDFPEGPFYPLLLSSLYGFCLMLSSDSFLTLFLGLEIMSLPVYVLVLLAFGRPESPEAALKYLVLGGTATAMFLMGVSLLYGGSATLALSSFAGALGSHDAMATAGIVLVILAFFLKAAIVPFHAWAPDAYEGASLPVTAYMATIIKAGVLLAALRLFGTTPLSGPMVGVIAVLPLVSIVWGNLTAMRQTSFRRMIAYSSIAHAGYVFYAFLGDGPGRLQAVVFYLLAYGLLNVLAFASIPPERRRRDPRSPRPAARPVPSRPLRRLDDRHRDAVARRHSAVSRLRRQVPHLQERDRRRLHVVRGARSRRELPRDLLLPARDPDDVHEPGGGHRHARGARSRGARRQRPLPRPDDPRRRVPGLDLRAVLRNGRSGLRDPV